MAIEIEWIDSISPQATGNKIYRDTVPSTGEVEIADIANGVQFYSDATVAEGTEYKFEVQAHDGAGDETTQEEEGKNMAYITTAIGDLYPQDNAASVDTEVESRGSWVEFGDNRVTINPISSDVYDGSWSLEMTNTAGNSQAVRGELSIAVENGESYDITCWAKKKAGTGNSSFTSWTGTSSAFFKAITNTAWTEYVWTGLVANDTTLLIRAYPSAETANAQLGDQILIDKFTIVKQ